MPNAQQYTYIYLDKRTHDLVLYGYTFAALALSIFLLYHFFPSILTGTAGAMITALFVVLVSICALILIWPMLMLKKKYRWFIHEGTAVLTERDATFAPGVTIAYSDINRLVCKNVADFGNRFEVLRIGHGARSFQIYGIEDRGSADETPLLQLTRAIGSACPQLAFSEEDGDIFYRIPAPEADPNAIHFRKR